MTQAYYTALLGRVKDMPTLASLLTPTDRPKAAQTPEEMRAAVGQWLAIAGAREPQT